LPLTGSFSDIDVAALLCPTPFLLPFSIFSTETELASAQIETEKANSDLEVGVMLEKDIDLILNNDVGEEEEALSHLLKELHVYYN
jgi:hypothetical protein